ncbi:MAG: HutD family protein [Crocinitomicaceae bacterium]
MIHLIKSNFEIKDWSGGTTTELFIYPEGAEYADLNFHFRLSTATVEVEESTFTSLPGVNRTLMVLYGQMDLIHEAQHKTSLLPFEQDEFKGDWITHSAGKCVDFNLMCRGKTSGELTGFALKKNQYRILDCDGDIQFLYIVNGSIELNRKTYFTNGLVRIKKLDMIEMKANEESEIVFIDITNP